MILAAPVCLTGTILRVFSQERTKPELLDPHGSARDLHRRLGSGSVVGGDPLAE